MGQAAKYGVRVWPVLQDIGQLETMFGDKGAQTFIANSGCLFAFTPGDDNTAAALSRHAGEHAVVHESYSDDPQGGRGRVSIDVRDERRWPADKIRSIPKFHGLVWKFGDVGAAARRLQALLHGDPNCLRLAQPDPYHTATAQSAAPFDEAAAAGRPPDRLRSGHGGGGCRVRAAAFGRTGNASAFAASLRGSVAAPSPASAGAYQRAITARLPARRAALR